MLDDDGREHGGRPVRLAFDSGRLCVAVDVSGLGPCCCHRAQTVGWAGAPHSLRRAARTGRPRGDWPLDVAERPHPPCRQSLQLRSLRRCYPRGRGCRRIFVASAEANGGQSPETRGEQGGQFQHGSSGWERPMRLEVNGLEQPEDVRRGAVNVPASRNKGGGFFRSRRPNLHVRRGSVEGVTCLRCPWRRRGRPRSRPRPCPAPCPGRRRSRRARPRRPDRSSWSARRGPWSAPGGRASARTSRS